MIHYPTGYYSKVSNPISCDDEKLSWKNSSVIEPVFRKFYDLPDPDPDSKKKIDFYCFLTSLRLFTFEK